MNNKDYKSIKERINKYYKDKKALNLNYIRLEGLNKKLFDIEKEINSPVFTASLNTDLKAVNYDNVYVTGGTPSSPIENEIENIYKAYEKEKVKILNEIYLTKKLIYELETNTEKFDCYIGMLSSEAKIIIEMVFKKGMSITATALNINMSKSSVSRKVEIISKDILLLCDNYKI